MQPSVERHLKAAARLRALDKSPTHMISIVCSPKGAVVGCLSTASTTRKCKRSLCIVALRPVMMPMWPTNVQSGEKGSRQPPTRLHSIRTMPLMFSNVKRIFRLQNKILRTLKSSCSFFCCSLIFLIMLNHRDANLLVADSKSATHKSFAAAPRFIDKRWQLQSNHF